MMRILKAVLIVVVQMGMNVLMILIIAFHLRVFVLEIFMENGFVMMIVMEELVLKLKIKNVT